MLMLCERTEPDETWHVAVLTDAGSVFALSADGNATLPMIHVPRGTRAVPYIASALAHTYGIKVFCLTDLRACSEDQSAERTMLADLCDEPCALPANARWIDSKDVLIGPERHLSTLVDICAAKGRDTERLGFCRRLQEWVRSVLADRDGTPHATADPIPTQWNAGHGFSLVRLQTSGPAVWFKSVGPPNEAEFNITARIAERHPHHSPRVLASHDTWCGWLTEEVPGHSLRHADADGWVRAATDIARVQLVECDRDDADVWLRSGCVDLRIQTLAPKVDEFFSGMEPIFDRQVKSSPPRLQRNELNETADALRYAFDIAARLPSALVHADLNPDNVFFRDGRAVFLDWAGACVGVPFTVLENLCGHLRRCRPADDITSERMVREAYGDVWRERYGTALVSDVLSVAPMLRYASMAMRSAGWLWQAATSATREPFLRSLTRSMHQAALASSVQ